jgi:hypothetical protein
VNSQRLQVQVALQCINNIILLLLGGQKYQSNVGLVLKRYTGVNHLKNKYVQLQRTKQD